MQPKQQHAIEQLPETGINSATVGKNIRLGHKYMWDSQRTGPDRPWPCRPECWHFHATFSAPSSRYVVCNKHQQAFMGHLFPNSESIITEYIAA